MIEVLAVLTLGGLFLILSRKEKATPSESLLVAGQLGRYRIRLMPKLNLARAFIESVNQRIKATDIACCSSTFYFAVRDKQVVANGFDVYLLAISCRHGTPYFQAALPLSDNPGNYLDTIREYANDVLSLLPAECCHNEKLDACINSAIRIEALEQGIEVTPLSG